MCIGWLFDLFLGAPVSPEEPGKRGSVGDPTSPDFYDQPGWADYLDDMEQEELEGFHDDGEEWW